MRAEIPRYFDYLIEGFGRGLIGRSVHLGHWDAPPAGGSAGPVEFAAAQDRLDDVVLGMADLGEGLAVLDVGCGFGGSLQKVDRRFGGMRLVGVNIDPRQLEICRPLAPRPSNRFEWVEADACDLPFAAGTFDRVLCIEAMFHFSSRRAFVREAARVLRPGGVFVASDLILARPSGRSGPLGFCVEALLRDGYGPWPEPWGEEGEEFGPTEVAGLTRSRIIDATAATRPSHRFTVPAHLDDRRDPGVPALRAALMLRWLHEHGHLRCVYLRFDKALDR